MNSKLLIDANKNYIINLRRHFHKYPELSNQEFKTSLKIQDELHKLNIPFQIVSPNGIVATLKGGSAVIALRADIDALPIQESTNLEFKSVHDGCSHACGHDSHIAMLLGAAKVLSENRELLTCTVKFIFQPAEETIDGATQIIESGLIDDVDCFVGLHIFPYMDTGKISVDPGPRYAAADWLKIKVIGKSGHGALPHFTVDPIYVGSQIVTGLQSIVSRECDPLEPVVISICSFQAGTAAGNVISQSAKLSGTVRTFNPQLRSDLPAIIGRVATGIAAAHKATCEVDYIFGIPATISDPHCSELGKIAVTNILGASGLQSHPPMTGGEDFSQYLQTKPGLYAFIGSRNTATHHDYSLHHECFDFDENAMLNGAAFYVEYVNVFQNSL
ncbi:M20 metallopeptidase family protein [Candidatus Epulonipiscium viviparus]|uniref:M20 metallopeptidase family protein n=1 Tax=Candidatus Epulonipiscium viviparus TaxID=420336 RepID=UPI000495A10F|nr:amidohydrolase [Candidatus Epulopiscium viviparus]